ncbi:MAG TPA: alpha-glucan family phosphorylase [Candidatus Limnocylindrales bacterium]|nr:alpha-glucan family phosphorylase [Candidatus Limnocylindrales bacterium]
MTPLPQIPSRLGRLSDLAQNLWWSWNPEARELFRKIDAPLWREVRHNPVRLLHEITSERLAQAAADPETARLYDQVLAALDLALAGRPSWCAQNHPELSEGLVGFFSAEYGVHNSLPFYAGGLGVLAGDIAKEASDLGIPMVGIGFMYPQGYFRQRVNAEGRQEEFYEQIDRDKVPVQRVLAPDGKHLTIPLSLPDRTVLLEAWRVDAGRTELYLLDTDLDENAPWDRELTARLYGGDHNVRLLQEIVLGVGGVRVLRALGKNPLVWHANEGHTGFMMLERTREAIAAGRSFEEAVAEVRAASIFTTHTPVAAGHDAFPVSMVDSQLSKVEGFGAPIQSLRPRLLALAEYEGAFNMTVLSMRLAGRVNAVSRRHGEVSRRMWASLWPGKPESEIPITSITNGVHVPTWTAQETSRLHRRRLGQDWMARHDDPKLWETAAEALPDDELWRTRKTLKGALLQYLRDRVRRRWSVDRVDPGQTVAFGSLLDRDAFTIGFARRFATYKRADLILRDHARLKRLLTDQRRPVQIIFAGKAHPADEHGKDLLQAVYRAARDPETAGRIAFLEDYDMHSAHWLVQGVDMWLNTPRPPLEASGTSGMKAGLNGVPSASILDGWWAEGYDGGNGWAFGPPPGSDEGAEASDADAENARDAESLYRVLEETIVPLYYDRDPEGVPHGWLRVVRRAMQTVTPAFSARRMMKEYAERMYLPAAKAPEEEPGALPRR